MDVPQINGKGNRILIVDDNIAIHDDFRKVLCGESTERIRKLRDLERSILDNDDTSGADHFTPPDYIVDSAYQGEESLAKIRESEVAGAPYGLVFMDVRMPPGWDGIETIRRIWNEFPHIEVVICTAYSDYSWEEILTKIGNSERLLFLRKPFDTVAVKQMALALTQKWHLARQVNRYVRQLEAEIAERQKSEERLQFQATHDSLTGLANRASLEEKLRKVLSQLGESQEKVGLFYIDLDRFKEINDTLGYRNGDVIIREMGSRLKTSMGADGFVARVYGNAFAILIPSLESTSASLEIAQRIQKVLEPPVALESLELEVRGSISVVLYPDHGSSADELMRRVDMTMLEAKRSNLKVTFYDPKFDLYSPERLTMLGELRKAISAGDLTLFYQPKIDLKLNYLRGFEALVRWQHPLRGLIPPGNFVPVAERGGLSKHLSLWVLDECARNWAGWREKNWDFPFSVNLSAHDLMDADLPETVAKILKRYGMPSSRLVLEITESAMMEDPDRARETMLSLSAMGVRLSIDDFGVGYSSLVYLKNSPVHELKIDRSFVLEMAENTDVMTIVRSIIELGHMLGLCVVAEGVERPLELELLKQMKCDAAQGHHICEPKPSHLIEEWRKISPWSRGETPRCGGELRP